MAKQWIDESGWDQLEQDLEYLNSVQINYGYLDNEQHPKSTHLTVPTVAAYNNEGVRNTSGGWKIPPRPFMDVAQDMAYIEMDTITKRLMLSVGWGKYGVQRHLDGIGADLADNIRLSIGSQEFVPLADSTISLKQSDVILIETGTLYDSARHEIGHYEDNVETK